MNDDIFSIAQAEAVAATSKPEWHEAFQEVCRQAIEQIHEHGFVMLRGPDGTEIVLDYRDR